MEILKDIQSKSLLVGLVSLFFTPILFAVEMTPEEKVNNAMSAAPTRISANATIIDHDGSVLRKGTNEWTCKPGKGPGSKSYPMCNDPVFMRWSKTVWKDKPFTTDVVGYSYMLAGGFAPDTIDPRIKKSANSINAHHEGPHIMLIMPTPDLSEGLSTDPKDNSIFVIFKGTPMEIVIIPIGDVIVE